MREQRDEAIEELGCPCVQVGRETRDLVAERQSQATHAGRRSRDLVGDIGRRPLISMVDTIGPT